MRINKTENIMGIYAANMNNKVRMNTKDTVKKDELNFSEKAKNFQVAMEKIKELPDIRVEKVERLKREVKTGTYRVEGRKIAEKILESVDFDKKI
jgi:flagellar biosynthesis anti-sigma factor FlgM